MPSSSCQVFCSAHHNAIFLVLLVWGYSFYHVLGRVTSTRQDLPFTFCPSEYMSRCESTSTSRLIEKKEKEGKRISNETESWKQSYQGKKTLADGGRHFTDSRERGVRRQLNSPS